MLKLHSHARLFIDFLRLDKSLLSPFALMTTYERIVLYKYVRKIQEMNRFLIIPLNGRVVCCAITFCCVTLCSRGNVAHLVVCQLSSVAI